MPVRSLHTSVLKWPSLKTVDRAVRSWSTEQAQYHPELRRLGYFGSYARGDWGVGSDLDLIAIVDEATDAFERRSSNWDINNLPVPADMLVYSQQEWKDLHAKKDRFSSVLKKEVIWIFSRDDNSQKWNRLR